MKLRNVRRMWRLLIAVGIVLLCLVLGLVLVPTVFTLNSMRDKIEIAFTDQTGVSAKINGDVHFSLLGRANIVAHDIAIPNGHISSVRFAVPLWSMFDIQNAKLDDKITVYGARIAIERLIPITMNYDIDIHNSIVRFLEKDYEIVSGKINHGNFSGTIRTDQHKYEINYSDGKFCDAFQPVLAYLGHNGRARLIVYSPYGCDEAQREYKSYVYDIEMQVAKK